MRVAIVGLGPSHHAFVRVAEGLGDWRVKYDEVWTVNGFSNVLPCTRGFAMDDVRVQQIRADGGNKKIANLLEALKRHEGPIYTSRPHPDYPGLVDYPLEAVVNFYGPRIREYFNSTIAYPLALAGMERAEYVDVYGADYTFPHRHLAEKGRACCEYWIGRLEGMGIKVWAPETSSLFDSDDASEIYGYDTVSIKRAWTEEGWLKLKFEPLEEKDWPTAKAIEQRYYKGLDDPNQLGKQ